MREVGDPDGAEVLLLAGDRDGNEPAVALLERGAELALRALDRGLRDRMDAAAVGGRVDGEELEGAHDFDLLAVGIEERPEMDASSAPAGRSTATSKRAAVDGELDRHDREPDHLAELGARGGRS